MFALLQVDSRGRGSEGLLHDIQWGIGCMETRKGTAAGCCLVGRAAMLQDDRTVNPLTGIGAPLTKSFDAIVCSECEMKKLFLSHAHT